jgi:hypothetical protein
LSTSRLAGWLYTQVLKTIRVKPKWLASIGLCRERCPVTSKDVEGSARHCKTVPGAGSHFCEFAGGVVQFVRTPACHAGGRGSSPFAPATFHCSCIILKHPTSVFSFVVASEGWDRFVANISSVVLRGFTVRVWSRRRLAWSRWRTGKSPTTRTSVFEHLVGMPGDLGFFFSSDDPHSHAAFRCANRRKIAAIV